MAGVGRTSSNETSTPVDNKPVCKANCNSLHEIRVSHPITTCGLTLDSSFKTTPTARPSFVIIMELITEPPTRPRIPSVPKYFFCVIMLPVEYRAFLRYVVLYRVGNWAYLFLIHEQIVHQHLMPLQDPFV